MAELVGGADRGVATLTAGALPGGHTDSFVALQPPSTTSVVAVT